MENKIKHLEIITKIIERMEKNSFFLKSWAMTLVVAICALSVNDSEKKFIIIALIPIIVFWFLDSFYLQIERKYRILYRNVSEKEEKQVDFGLELSTLVLSESDRKRTNFVKCLFSFSEILFYMPLTLALIVIISLLKIF